MVFFVCDGCSETLKKNQVDAHAARCRKCDSVCCVDCNVSFFGDDYRAHTSCITESERYEGKFAKQQSKRNPQQEWMAVVHHCASTAPMHLKGYFRTMSTLDNIPRKEKQFRNFTSNSLGLRGANQQVVGEIWTVLKAEREKRQAQKQEQLEKAKEKKKQQEEEQSSAKAAADEKEAKADDSSDDESSSKKKEKTKATTTPSKQHSVIKQDKVRTLMKRALRKAPNRCMKIKELRKVLGLKLGVSKAEEKLLKKLLKDPTTFSKDKHRIFKVDGKMVTLQKQKD